MGTDIHALPVGYDEYSVPENEELYAYARASAGRLDLWRLLCKESYEAAQIQLGQVRRKQKQLSLPCAEIPVEQLWLRLRDVWSSYLEEVGPAALAWEILVATTNFCTIVRFVTTCAVIEDVTGSPANIWWHS